jgi:hypothetical protein
MDLRWIKNAAATLRPFARLGWYLAHGSAIGMMLANLLFLCFWLTIDADAQCLIELDIAVIVIGGAAGVTPQTSLVVRWYEYLERKRYTQTIIVMVVGLPILVVAFVIYKGVSVSLRAQETLQANRLVLEKLMKYLGEHPNRWPKDWEELAQTRDDSFQGMFRWPEDIPEIRKRVEIDFQVTRADVAAMKVEEFSAVRPIGPNYGPEEERIKQLIDIASGFYGPPVPADRAFR